MKSKTISSILISTVVFFATVGCESIKEFATSPDVVEGVRELFFKATTKVAEKNPIYTATIDKINDAVANYQGEEITAAAIADLVIDSVGENDALKEEISNELKAAIGKITASGNKATAQSIIFEAAILLE